jgi:hypothetical protein
MKYTNKFWKPAAAVAVIFAGGVGSWWGTHLTGESTAVLGGLRIVSAGAQTTTPGPITAAQAVQIVVGKLSQLDPGIDWNADMQVADVQEFPQLTQAVDNGTGLVRYHRSSPIDAWVVVIPVAAAQANGLGIVSNNVSGARCNDTLGTGVCDPPGTLLNAQVQTGPTGSVFPTCTAPASNPQQFVQCETK